MGASKEDFKQVNKFLKNIGVSFLSFDQRGWGENSHWKYHSLGTTISDIQDVISVLNENLSNQKIILLGESLGSALAVLAAKKLKNMVSGVVVTNFITKRKVFKPKIKLVLKTFLGFFFHKHTNLPIKLYTEDVSVNPDYIEEANDRNVRNMPFTVLYAVQAKSVNTKVVKNINQSTCPILVIQSGEDIFADFDKIKSNQGKWRQGVTYKFYPKGKHAILNEPNINEILKDANKWIEDNIK